MKLEKPLNLSFETECHTWMSSPLELGSIQIGSSANGRGEELEKELLEKNRQIDVKNRELSDLKIRNHQLLVEVQEAKERQRLMNEELKKAEANIELIMNLIGRDNDVSQNTR